jgi:hypothetical protein
LERRENGRKRDYDLWRKVRVPWKKNKPEGIGVYVFENEEVFEGYWKGGVWKS